jgi:26S proteasome regulatory subunit N9
LDFIKEPESAPFQIGLYQNFVADWESKINKLSLVSIALQAARQFSGKTFNLIE